MKTKGKGSMCIGETFYWMAVTSVICFAFTGFVHYFWRDKLSGDWYKRTRLRGLYIVAGLAMIASILSVIFGTDC